MSGMHTHSHTHAFTHSDQAHNTGQKEGEGSAGLPCSISGDLTFCLSVKYLLIFVCLAAAAHRPYASRWDLHTFVHRPSSELIQHDDAVQSY